LANIEIGEKMKGKVTKINPTTRLKFLVERHQQLDDEADELQTRSYLSPYDRDRLKLVKVMRLKAKEAMEKYRISIDGPQTAHIT